MSYIPLTLKYRPRRWADLVGQDVVRTTIPNMFSQGRLLQSIVLGGSRGIGKTTTARILARALNCEAKTPDFEPCATCPSCLEISEDRSMAVQELDAASNGLVDDVRRIKEEVRYADDSRYRVYIIDECHSLTNAAWQAFLKLLEEPPPNVVFVFCTTEVHKIPETIISRSAHFSFPRMKMESIVSRLEYISNLEKYEVEPGALQLIARHVNGGMRDAISILDQVVSFSNDKKVSKDAVTEVVGVVSTGLMFELFAALVSCNVKALYVLLQKAYSEVSDVSVLVNDLTMFYRDMMLCKVEVPIPDAQHDYVNALKHAAQMVTVEYLLEAQNQLHNIADQMRRSKLPSRSILDVYITKLFYGGLRQTAPVQAPVSASPLRAVEVVLTPTDLATAFEGSVLSM